MLKESTVEAVARVASQAVDTPLCVADAGLNVRLLLNDDGAFGKNAASLAACGGGEAGAVARAAELSLRITPVERGGRTLCYVITPEGRGEAATDYMKVLIAAECGLDAEEEAAAPERRRTMLVSQLAGSGRIDSEAESYLSALGYQRDVPRCAVLFAASGGGTEAEGVFAAIERRAGELGLFGAQDIYGCADAGQMIVFKAAADEERAARAREIEQTARRVAELLPEGAKLSVCAGSVYPRAELLHNSYSEAAYLYSRRGGRGESGECLFIDDFIFEWLFSNLDGAARRSLTRDISSALGAGREMAETAAALSEEDCSPIRCAGALSVHRNTILQRMRKMKENTALDPLHSVRDRVALRACVLHRTKKTVWNGGVIVQPGSVVSDGLKHLSELLYKKSGGSFQINMHTISTSGDNYKLLGMLMSGALNIVVSSAIALCPYTDNKVFTLHLPFLFDSAEEADYLAREVILPELRDGLDETGIICPSLWSLGWRYITSSGSPIRTPEDLRGRRIRILASPSIRNCFARLGAVPIQIYYNNIKDALASKMIDSQENPYKNILDMEFYKYQEFVTELHMWYSMEALCFSQRSWLELDAEKQKMLREAVDESGAWVLRRQAESNLAAKNELLRLGMKAVVPTAEEEAMWRATVRPLYETEPRRDFLTRIMKAKRSYAAGGR